MKFKLELSREGLNLAAVFIGFDNALDNEYLEFENAHGKTWMFYRIITHKDGVAGFVQRPLSVSEFKKIKSYSKKTLEA